MVELEKVWNDFEKEKEQKNKNVIQKNKIAICYNCNSINLHTDNYQIICFDCGLILGDDRIISEQNFESTTLNSNQHHAKSKGYGNKLTKMQEWYMWSNDEKNTYKLKIYIKKLCDKLQIPDYLLESINSTCTMVLDCIKKTDGTKRAKVKDGILVICIYYVTKDTHTPFSYITMAKQLDLNIKYVTRAERLILELVNSKRLNLDKRIILDTKKPYDYIQETIHKYNMKISEDILKLVKVLIDICEDNDLLLDHTPLSIGVSCFYYILKLKTIDIDLKIFSDFYNLSMVTVTKTYNKLKIYETKINNYLLKYTQDNFPN